nr:DUF6555 family protein [uncultured Pseudomonas sp.]
MARSIGYLGGATNGGKTTVRRVRRRWRKLYRPSRFHNIKPWTVVLRVALRNRVAMIDAKLFVIDYALHGQHKSFIIRAERMDNAEAWHWASCDAGVGKIGRYGREKIKKVSRPMAERYGISEVSWRASG